MLAVPSQFPYGLLKVMLRLHNKVHGEVEGIPVMEENGEVARWW